jgi:hypothetical protein
VNGGAVEGAIFRNWTFAPLSTGYYEVSVRTTDSLGSTSVSNQTEVTVIPMLGDLNDDGKVDMKDISTVASGFGVAPGHPRWNPEADQNFDNKIDLRDIATVAKHFGTTCL